MELGKMRHVVTIQTRSVTRDTDGQPLNSWVDTTTRRAAITPTGSNESIVNGKTLTRQTFDVTMRFYDGLSTTHRLKWGTRILRITDVTNPDAMEVEHSVKCVEEVD